MKKEFRKISFMGWLVCLLRKDRQANVIDLDKEKKILERIMRKKSNDL